MDNTKALYGILYIPTGEILINPFSKTLWLFSVKKVAEDLVFHKLVGFVNGNHLYYTDIMNANNLPDPVVEAEFEIVEVLYDPYTET